MSFSPIHASPGAGLAESSGAAVLHSHHYHGSLLRALYEAQGIDPAGILLDAVEACGTGAAAPVPADCGEGWGWLAERFRAAGLGGLACDQLKTAGTGRVLLRSSHFAAAWRARYAPARRPVCAVPAGLLARLLSQATGSDRTVIESACAAQGADACTFEVAATKNASPAAPAPEPRPAALPSAGDAARSGDTGALLGRPLAASGEGTVEGPGGPFAALPAEFYAAATRLFEIEVPRARGAKFGSLPGILLMEAAHWNGFQLFAEVLSSAEWGEAGHGQADSDHERVQALLSIPEQLGWGSWEICSFVAGERLLVRVHDSYEALGYERLFGRSAEPRCVVARGAAAAVMNLLYRSGGSAPGARDTSTYNSLFRSPHTFRAVETRCRAQGDPFCELVANPLTV